MGPRRRWSFIALAAAATGVASFVAPEDQKAVEVAAPLARAHVVPALRPQASTTDLPAREPIGTPHGELFAARSWAPPPAVLAERQLAEPAAPPNPYRFAGSSQHNGVRRVFLIMGDRIFEAREGEMLEGNYRVQSVVAEAVTLIYEPLDIRVYIATIFPETPSSEVGGTVPPPRPPVASAPSKP